jgi:hypothetical protein
VTKIDEGTVNELKQWYISNVNAKSVTKTNGNNKMGYQELNRAVSNRRRDKEKDRGREDSNKSSDKDDNNKSSDKVIDNDKDRNNDNPTPTPSKQLPI